jgi:hypothetical protein
MSTLTTLYQSDLLTVREYNCDRPPGCKAVEETPDKDEFVFILQGIYQRRCRAEPALKMILNMN